MDKYKGYRNFETWKVMDEFFDEIIVDERTTGDECYDYLKDSLGIVDDESFPYKYDSTIDEFRDFAVLHFLDRVDWDEIADQVNEHSGIENECEMCGATIDYNETTCSFTCFQASMR